MKRIGILTAGGDTPALNATAVIVTASGGERIRCAEPNAP